MCRQRYITFVIHPPLMMAQSWAESTWEITNYGRFIKQFPPNIIRSIRQFEKINKKYVGKKCLLYSIKYIYIYIYIYPTEWKRIKSRKWFWWSVYIFITMYVSPIRISADEESETILNKIWEHYNCLWLKNKVCVEIFKVEAAKMFEIVVKLLLRLLIRWFIVALFT